MSLDLIEKAHYKHARTDATGISVYALLSQEDSDIKMVIRQNCKDLTLTYVSLEYLGICFVNLYLFQSFDDAHIHLERNVSFIGLLKVKE